jgi:hypothetical protein
MHSKDKQGALGNELDVTVTYPERLTDEPYQTDTDEGGTEIEQRHTAQLETEGDDGTVEPFETETHSET